MAVTLADLKPNLKNPRKITARKRAMLENSMQKFGDLGGIVRNRRSGQIVGGHQRVNAFMALGANANIVIERSYNPPTKTGTTAEGYVEMAGERFAYRETDWPAAIETAANLAANKGAGEFDLPMLTDMFDELSLTELDLDLTMFDDVERDSLRPSAEEGPEEDLDEGDAEGSLTIDTKTKPGDVYELGKHRLICGDSSDPNVLDALLAGDEATVVYTDPPYGISLDTKYSDSRDELDGSKYSKNAKLAAKKRNNHAPIHGDDEEYDPQFLLGYFQSAREIFLWGADYYAKTLPEGGNYICWDKRSNAQGEEIKQFNASHFELCWSRERHMKEIIRVLWSGICQSEKEKYVHPSQKPIKLAQEFFRRFAKEGDVVVDLYGGSGSTLLACERDNLCCRMAEIDPYYCDVIVARWEKATNQTAVRLKGND